MFKPDAVRTDDCKKGVSKMKKIMLIALLAVGICGCATKAPLLRLSTIASQNNARLVNLSVGMNRDQAMAAMGTDAARTWCWLLTINVSNPYKSEILEGNGAKFEVLYYYTNAGDWQCGASDDELTPLVFMDNSLIGWGQDFLRETKIKYNII